MTEYWNWARTYNCRPRLYVEPTSIESLRSVLIKVNETKSKVRVIGSAHSPSSLAMSNDVLISMKHFNRIIEIDEINRTLHCESGVLLSTLNEILPKHNLALPVQGSVSELTIGGTISTATHGSGINFGTLSSYVRSITVMKLNGEMCEYRLEDNEDIFRCLTCSLGTFGVIVDVRFELSELFHLKLNQHLLEFDTFLNTLPVHYTSSDHFRYMWYPHTNNGIAYHLTRMPPQKVNTKKSLFAKSFSWLRHSIIGHHLLEFLFYLSLYIPYLVRLINKIYVKLDGKSITKVDRGDKLFNFDCLFYQYATEWAIPVDKAVACLKEIEESMEQHKYVHFPIEIRFSNEDNLSYLSPSYKRKTCWINTVAYRPYGKIHTQHQPFFKTFETICYKHGGRPHWAKEHPLKSNEFSKLYSNWNTFNRLRKIFDPNDLLVNDCLETIFS